MAADRVADEGIAASGRGLAVEDWDEVVAVFAADILACLTSDGFHGRIEVGVAGDGIGLLAGLDALGPTNDEGDAVTAFVDVGLVATEAAAGIVTVLFEDLEVACG